MNTVVKKKSPIVVPETLRPRATAEDEYTTGQRRIIDAQLKEGLEDIRRGRTFGPFGTAEEMAASIESNIKKVRAAKRKTKPAR